MGVYLGETNDYNAMQGPASSGFHVPLSSERQAVYNAGVTLGAWTSTGGDNFKNYLKLPFVGYRNSTNGGIAAQGSNAIYWSSSNYIGSYAFYLTFSSSSITPQQAASRTIGGSIRPFKNSPVTPDSSRTVLYQGTGDAGIYHNSSLGLISISSDGITWITIADKNLGATTVYNNGNTLSQNNCGYYYEWGNNYGFPRTGGVTTSSTKVDASGYGPGNYYSSSTFITGNGSWDTTANSNLRGSETKIPAELKNAYIGEYHETRILEDNFSGTTLNSDIWSTVYLNSIGTITVNNGLSMSGGSGSGGPLIYTKKTYEGGESKITVEYTITAEGGTYKEAKRGVLLDLDNIDNGWYVFAIVEQRMSTWNNMTRLYLQNGIKSSTNIDPAGIVNPTYIGKIVIDINAGTYEYYTNNSLVSSGAVQYPLSSCIGRPIFFMDASNRTSVSFSCSNVKITVEY